MCSSDRCTRSRSTFVALIELPELCRCVAHSRFHLREERCDSIAHFPHAQMNLQLAVVDESLPPREPRREQRFDSLMIGAMLRVCEWLHDPAARAAL